MSSRSGSPPGSPPADPGGDPLADPLLRELQGEGLNIEDEGDALLAELDQGEEKEAGKEEKEEDQGDALLAELEEDELRLLSKLNLLPSLSARPASAASAASAERPSREEMLPSLQHLPATLLQQQARRFLAQLEANRAAYLKHFSLEHMRYFYQDLAADPPTTSWDPPPGCRDLPPPPWLAIGPGRAEPPAPAVRLQSQVRRFLAYRRFLRLMQETYVRQWDQTSGAWFFQDARSGEVTWAPPLLWPPDKPYSPETNRGGGGGGGGGGPGDDDDGEDDERTLALLAKRRADPAARKQRQLGRRALNRKPARGPAGMYAKLGAVVPVMDGTKRLYVEVDPHLLARAAFEKGPTALLRVIDKYPTAEVLFYAFEMLSRFDLREDPETGRATQEAADCIEFVCDALVRMAGREPIMAKVLQAMASLAGNYANRRIFMRRGVVELTRDAVENLDLQPNRVPDAEHLDYPSSHGVAICTYSLRVLGEMAYDMDNRGEVAQDGIGVAVSAMRACCLDPVVQLVGCDTLYNLVYRNQAGHEMAHQMGAPAVVDAARKLFQSDLELQQHAARAEALLQEDGWRGFEQ